MNFYSDKYGSILLIINREPIINIAGKNFPGGKIRIPGGTAGTAGKKYEYTIIT